MREWIGIGTNAVLLLLGGALTMSSSTVAGTGSLANRGSVTLTTTTFGVPLDNQGTLFFQGTSSMSGALTTGAGTTLRVQGSNTVGSTRRPPIT